MTLRLCVECGEPADGSRCPAHAVSTLRVKEKTAARGYGAAWQRLSRRAREIQSWCSDCGTTVDLTTDHLRWPARTLKDVDVVCRACNTRRGKTPRDGNPRGQTPAHDRPDLPRESFRPTHTGFGS